MSVEEKKAAEANGTEALREVHSETPSDSTSEELPHYGKRNGRAECVYISIAVILGASLIAVLVYFSVTNALKSEDPEPVDQGAVFGTTTPYMTTEASTVVFPPPLGTPEDEETTGATTTTTADPGPDMSDKGSLLRGGFRGPADNSRAAPRGAAPRMGPMPTDPPTTNPTTAA